MGGDFDAMRKQRPSGVNGGGASAGGTGGREQRTFLLGNESDED